MARKRRSRRISFNRRRRHRRNVGYGYNPSLSLSHPLSAVKAGFNMGALKRAGILSGGAIGGGLVSGALNQYVVGPYLPSVAGNKYAGYAVGLASAGLVGAIGGMVAPRFAGDLMTGAVVKVVADVINDLNLGGITAFKGMGDFLTQRNVDSARALGGLRDFLTQRGVDSAKSLNGLNDASETF
ncbi:MAG: hypothetical protein PHR35_18875 [Kiritimatiellae bacterium]|nr:hypothetical protein [Kiritimatiellia bacterium]